MGTTYEVDKSVQASVEDFPALRGLGLGHTELESLRRKGYLNQDARGQRHGGYWRLRFRTAGRTRTVYVGRDELLIANVRQELDALQLEYRLRRQISKTIATGRRVLRNAKRRLEPVLRQLGMHYHGDTMRKIAATPMPPKRT